VQMVKSDPEAQKKSSLSDCTWLERWVWILNLETFEIPNLLWRTREFTLFYFYKLIYIFFFLYLFSHIFFPLSFFSLYSFFSLIIFCFP
jgi:hypothetical protein